ncbi:flagellar assembly protein FliH [Acerihabitans arboris]|uniref:Flagellar assembly protein FliH n=1 Tax=Acerihabitans arboris TaxID=2691583 RepID=A0A845SGT2_9GAMM|nr:flagellar assembly protein FliH [Acerihabitans arboris]NDL62602.1 flagellar assembly protein FliH [Acerihabitans arboris]
MSDAFNHLPWRPWALTDLACPVPPAPLPDAVDARTDDAQIQQSALNALRNQAKQEAHRSGYAEGVKQGQQEGYQDGLRAGQEEGRLQIQRDQQPAVAQLQMLVNEFQHTLDTLDSVMAERLAQLALTAARQVLGQEPAGGGEAMLRQIQRLMQQEPLLGGKPQLRVHPTLVPLVEQHLGATLKLHGWRVIPDDELHPGGCKVTSPEGDLDASLATRWHELCRLAAPGEL